MIVKRVAALVCGLAVMVGLMATASATELPLSSPMRPSYALMERCGHTPVEVDGESGSSTVTISGVPAGCAGFPLSVWLHEAGVTHHGAALAASPGEDVTVTVDGLELSPETTALVTAATWPLATTTDVRELPFVSCRTPDHPEVGCEVVVTGDHHWGWPTPTDWIRDLRVTTSSPTLVRWELVINLSHDSLPFHPTRSLNSNALVLVASSGCDAEPRTVTARGTTAWGPFHTVSAEAPRTLQINGRSTAGSDGLLDCP